MATYVIGDIHNSLSKLDSLFKQMSLSINDHIYFLGDLFDRGGAEPDPVGVYFRICGLNSHVTWIRGNHDQLLAEYIRYYYETPEKKRDSLIPYHYNSFDMMKERLTEVDILNLSDQIMKLPLQVEVEIGSERYLLAHARTSFPFLGEVKKERYLEGDDTSDEYLRNGIDGFISMVGHMDSSYMMSCGYGRFLDEKSGSIWTNDKENLYLMDCGCGLAGGQLACICLETGERYYS